MRILDTIRYFLPGAWQLAFDADGILLKPEGPSSCPANPPLSCALLDPQSVDTCCLNYPGGQILQTQFWNSDSTKGPPGYLGPKDSWTIHGLWSVACPPMAKLTNSGLIIVMGVLILYAIVLGVATVVAATTSANRCLAIQIMQMYR
jgi:hypothetical protein